jgi:hypothetical protein
VPARIRRGQLVRSGNAPARGRSGGQLAPARPPLRGGGQWWQRRVRRGLVPIGRPSWIGMTVVGSARTPCERARRRDRHVRSPQFGERGVQDVFGGRGGCGSSALSESCSKSAYAFPMMSSAVRVVVNSDSSFAFRARSRSNSAASADRRGRFADHRESVTPSKAPASRARVHSITCDEYKPSRRRITPFSPFGAFSYSATIASLYSALNERRDGRGDGPPPTAAPTTAGPARLVPRRRPAPRRHDAPSLTRAPGSPITPSAVNR